MDGNRSFIPVRSFKVNVFRSPRIERGSLPPFSWAKRERRDLYLPLLMCTNALQGKYDRRRRVLLRLCCWMQRTHFHKTSFLHDFNGIPIVEERERGRNGARRRALSPAAASAGSLQRPGAGGSPPRPTPPPRLPVALRRRCNHLAKLSKFPVATFEKHAATADPSSRSRERRIVIPLETEGKRSNVIMHL